MSENVFAKINGNLNKEFIRSGSTRWKKNLRLWQGDQGPVL
jgi:head-tail adaptor